MSDTEARGHSSVSAEESQRTEVVDPGGPGHEALVVPAEAAPTETISEPGKVMRIGSMVKQLLDEVKAAPLDAASRERLAGIYQRSIDELMTAMSPDLQGELRSMALPFQPGEVPSDSELRIAQAQLVGWLEGLFHGIQTALFAQQMAAQQQLQGIRRALPPGHPQADTGPEQHPGVAGLAGPTGQYL